MTEFSEPIDKFLLKAAVALQSRATQIAPFDKGRLRADITVFPQTKSAEIEVGNSAAIYYAKWVYFGTKPHEIKPKRKKALKTPYGVYKKVRHPGTKPNPYLEDAMRELLHSGEFSRILEEFADSMEQDIYDKITQNLTKIREV